MKKQVVLPSSQLLVAVAEEHRSQELVEGTLEQIGMDSYHTEWSVSHTVVNLRCGHKTADARHTSAVRVGVQSAGSRHTLGLGSAECIGLEVPVVDSSGCCHHRML